MAATLEQMLRIADEATANVLRQGSASRAGLSLRYATCAATPEIGDNGHGSGGQTRSAVGVANMRERAQLLPHGQFSFAFEPNRDTCVRVSFSIDGIPAA